MTFIIPIALIILVIYVTIKAISKEIKEEQKEQEELAKKKIEEDWNNHIETMKNKGQEKHPTNEQQPQEELKPPLTPNNQGDKMNRCKICGQPCGIYEICRECQKDIAEGKVSICQNCNQYYISAIGCDCTKQSQTITNEENNDSDNAKEKQQPQETNININTESEESHPFKEGFGKSMGCGCGILTLIGIVALILIISGGSVIEEIFG